MTAIIPVRNGERTLAASLDALGAQLASSDELIVIDDHSDDGTAAIARRYTERVLSMPEGATGAAAARNLGAEAATHGILVFCDADVLVDPGSRDRLLAPVRGPAVGAVGVYAPCAETLGMWSRVKDTSIRVRHARSGRRIRWFWTGFSAIRRDAFRAVGGFDETHFPTGATVEDIDLGLRLSRDGHELVQVFDATARHEHSAVSLARNDFRKARAWAAALRRAGPDAAAAHGSTSGTEAAALGLATASAGLVSLGAVFPPLAATAAVPLSAYAWLIRDEIACAWHRGGPGEATRQLLVRAALGPVAVAGAALGALSSPRGAPD